MMKLAKALKGKNKKNSESLVYAIGGGKGGIGKSFITSNLATHLSRSGLKVLLVDLDLGGANAHTYLKVSTSGKTAKDYLLGDVSHLGEVVVETPYKNLSMIKGATDWDEVITLNEKTIKQFLNATQNLGFDRVIYDLGAGTGAETLEAFLHADIQIAVSTPEPISIENTYNFLKKCFYKKLRQQSDILDFNEKLNQILNNKKDYNIKNPSDLLKYIEKTFPDTGAKLKAGIGELCPKVLINQCRSPKDQNIGKSFSHISRKYFGIDIRNIGNVEYDNRVWQSIRSMQPLFIEFPESEVLSDFKKIFDSIEGSYEPAKQDDERIVA